MQMYLAQNNNKTLLVDLAFVDYDGWFGGKARSVQLKELIEEAGFTFSRINLPMPNKLQVLWFGLLFFLRFGYFKPFCYRSLVNSAYLFYRYRKILRDNPQISMVIKEGTGYGDLVLADIVKFYNRKIVFIPANIESLADYDNAWTHTIAKTQRFSNEIRYFKKADAVWCISEEETWLLRIFGCNARFLPYSPPKVLTTIIENRRLNRKADENFGFLTFGRFDNPLHRGGLLNFLTKLQQGKVKFPYKLKIAGVGSEYFASLVNGLSDVKVLGELTDSELENCLLKCMGTLFWHQPSSGMLTRVPDMIMSGIPVIGNEDAVKSYLWMKGVDVWGDDMILEPPDYNEFVKKNKIFYSEFIDSLADI